MAVALITYFFLTLAPAWAQGYPIAIGCSANGRKVVVLRSEGGVATSTDSGITWRTNAGLGTPWACVASSADGTRLVAGSASGALALGIHTSSNSGVTWSSNNAAFHYWYKVACSADGFRLIAAAFAGPVVTSTNAGLTWRTNDLPEWDWASVASSADGTTLAAIAYGNNGPPGGIFTSTNGGFNWISIACSADGTRLAAGTSGQGIFLSTNSGGNWIKVTNGPSSGSVKCSADGFTVIVLHAPNNIYRSTNFGETWALAQFLGVDNRYALTTSADANRVFVLDGFLDRVEFMQFPVTPALRITPSPGGGLVLSWPVPSTNFVVQHTSELWPTNWVDFVVPPTRTNYNFEVTLSSSFIQFTNPQYFRLRSIP